MESLLKFIPLDTLLSLVLPYALSKAGNYFKNRDKDTVGTDDAFGNILIALSPAFLALTEPNHETALHKALLATRTAIDAYLAQSAAPDTASSDSLKV